MSNPKISVIVPIYNAEEYLAECLESLAQQRFDSCEVIMVNDGSSDSSADIAQRFAAEHGRFRYFETENQGPGAARNYALQHARGKYVAFCDSDDMIPPFAYKHMVAMAEKHGCDIVIGAAGRFNSERRFPSRLHRKALLGLDEIVHIKTHHQLIYDTTACKNLYSHEFLNRVDFAFPESMVFEDIPAIIRLHYLAESCAFLDEIVYLWRIRDKQSQSITQDKVAAGALEDRVKAMKMVDEFFTENVREPDLTRAKDRKWLANDLMIYVNRLCDVEDALRRDEMRGIILDYASGIDSGAFEDIDAINRIKYRFLQAEDYRGLQETIELAHTSAGDWKATRCEDGQYYGWPQFESFGHSIRRMTTEVVHKGLHASVERATFQEGGLTVEFDLDMANVRTSVDDSYEVAVVLHPCAAGAHEGHFASIEHMHMRGGESRGQSEGADGTCHVRAMIPASVLGSLEYGTYKIALNVRYNGLELDPAILGNPRKGRRARPYAFVHGGRTATVLYNSTRELKLQIAELNAPTIAAIRDSGTHLEATDTAGTVHRIDYADIDVANHRVGDPMERPYYFLGRDPLACAYQGGILRMSRISSGQPYVAKIDKGILLVDAHVAKSKLLLSLCPSKSLGDGRTLRLTLRSGTDEIAGKYLKARSESGEIHAEINLPRWFSTPFKPGKTYTLRAIDELGNNYPIVRDPSSCADLNAAIATGRRSYSICVDDKGCSVTVA